MRLFAIARNAFTETIRQPIFGVLILVTFTVLVLDLPLSGWTLGRGAGLYGKTDQQLMINLGLSTLLVSGLFIGAFSAGGVLSREIEERTVLTVLAKPVPRAMIVAGKFLGVAAAMVVAYYLCSLVLLMTIRHRVMPRASDPLDLPVIVLGCSALALAFISGLFCNFFFGWHFASSAVALAAVLLTLAAGAIGFIGKGWVLVPFGQGIPPEVLVGMLLMLMAVLVFAAVAVAASTRLGQFMTLLVCAAFFLTSSVTHSLFGKYAGRTVVAAVAYRVWPNLTFFYALDALVGGRSIPAGYVLLSAAYAACHVVAILAIGVVLFQRRELEARAGAQTAPRLVSIWAWAGRGAALAAGIAAVVVPTAMDLPAVRSVLAAGLLAASAAGLWLLSGWFGRGVKWTYYFVFVCAGVAAVVGAVVLGAPAARGWHPGPTGLIAAQLVAGALTVLVLVLPGSRHHFGLAGYARGGRDGARRRPLTPPPAGA